MIISRAAESIEAYSHSMRPVGKLYSLASSPDGYECVTRLPEPDCFCSLRGTGAAKMRESRSRD
eukprot:8194258-Pyramimonas_sp.AAC.2